MDEKKIKNPSSQFKNKKKKLRYFKWEKKEKISQKN